jgi:hypothetical protein
VLQSFVVHAIIPVLLCGRSFGALLPSHVVADIVYVLSELVLTSSKFMAQFYESKGLVALDAIDCFSCDGVDDTASQSNVTATVSALQIASQLARNSENYFGQLLATFTPPILAALLQSVRSAKCIQLYYVSMRCLHCCCRIQMSFDRKLAISWAIFAGNQPLYPVTI